MATAALLLVVPVVVSSTSQVAGGLALPPTMIGAEEAVQSSQLRGVNPAQVSAWTGDLNRALGILSAGNGSSQSLQAADAIAADVLANATAAASSAGSNRSIAVTAEYAAVVPVSVAAAFISLALIEGMEGRGRRNKMKMTVRARERKGQ